MSIKLYKKYKNPCAKEYIKQNFIQIAQRQLNYGPSESFYELLNLRLATKANWQNCFTWFRVRIVQM